jgi:hypothetical protein
MEPNYSVKLQAVKNAAAEGISPSYVSRVHRMTLFAPDLVEAALAERQPAGMTLASAMGVKSVKWER